MKHLIITVHGIRTFGRWQERLEKLLKPEDRDVRSGSADTLTVVNFKYNYFPLLAFLIPPLREQEVRRFRNSILKMMEVKTQNERWDRIDLVGHSFGTHIIGWALYGIEEPRRPAIHTVILAGSVLKENFPWQELIGKSIRRLVNDCGNRDYILMFANRVFAIGTGTAGVNGFIGPTGGNFRNRYFEHGHSGYFELNGVADDTFMKEHWFPLLTSEGDVKALDMRTTNWFSGPRAVLVSVLDPIKLIIYLSLLIFPTWYIWGLYQQAETQRKAAEDAILAATKTANELVLGIAQDYSGTLGVPQKMISRLFDESKTLIGNLTASGSTSQEVQQSRGIALSEISGVELALDPEAAWETANEAVGIFRNLSSAPNLAVALDRRGDAALKKGDAEHALRDFNEFLTLSGDDTNYSAIAHEKIGSVLLKNEDYTSALKHFAESGKLIGPPQTLPQKSPEQRRQSATLAGNSALALEGLWHLARAERKYRESLAIIGDIAAELPQRIDLKEDLSLAYRDLGNFLALYGDKKEALHVFEEASALNRVLAESDLERIDWQIDYVESLLRLAHAYVESDNPTKAMDLFGGATQRSLDLARAHEDQDRLKDLVALSYHNLAEAQNKAGDVKDAEVSYRQSFDVRLDLARRNKSVSPELSKSMLVLCEIYLEAGEPQRATDAAQLVVKLFREYKQQPVSELANSLGNLAWFALFARQPQEALSAANEAINLAPDLDWIRLNQAHALMFTDSDKAIDLYLWKHLDKSMPAEWNKWIKEDFRKFRMRGLTHPLMTVVESRIGTGEKYDQ